VYCLSLECQLYGAIAIDFSSSSVRTLPRSWSQVLIILPGTFITGYSLTATGLVTLWRTTSGNPVGTIGKRLDPNTNTFRMFQYSWDQIHGGESYQVVSCTLTSSQLQVDIPPVLSSVSVDPGGFYVYTNGYFSLDGSAIYMIGVDARDHRYFGQASTTSSSSVDWLSLNSDWSTPFIVDTGDYLLMMDYERLFILTCPSSSSVLGILAFVFSGVAAALLILIKASLLLFLPSFSWN
jgi:hypothetical protein